MLSICFEIEEKILFLNKKTGLESLVSRFDNNGAVENQKQQELLEKRLAAVPTRVQPLRTCQKNKDPFINRDVIVFWPQFNKWYPGTVMCLSESPKGTHDIQYWDDNNLYPEIMVPSPKGALGKFHFLDQ
jgi:hypothetical protein